MDPYTYLTWLLKQAKDIDLSDKKCAKFVALKYSKEYFSK